MKPKIRVLVVDDSAVVRKLVTDALSKDPEIEVVGTAIDPYVARDKIIELKPDVMTLDIEMPRMDGITFLKILMQHHPLPILIMSSLTQPGSAKVMEALQAGAVDVLAKPSTAFSIGDMGEQLVEKIKAAALVKLRPGRASPAPAAAAQPPEKLVSSASGYDPRQLILMAASTGGTEALASVLQQLPDGLPGICIVQHIPAYFSKSFAERLNGLCQFEVREAVDGDAVRPGLALVAPGNYHMLIHRTGNQYHVSLKQGPLVHHQRPAADVMFNSAVDLVKNYGVGVILTGMGKDGADGLKKLRDVGTRTIAQNEATCVVYGMPRAAVELGAIDHILPLDKIPQGIMKLIATPTGGR